MLLVQSIYWVITIMRKKEVCCRITIEQTNFGLGIYALKGGIQRRPGSTRRPPLWLDTKMQAATLDQMSIILEIKDVL